MAVIIILSNPAQPVDVLIPDVGVEVPGLGGSVSIEELDELWDIAQSKDLVALCQDDAFGVGSSTLILNDGTDNIDQDVADEFLETGFLTRVGPYAALLRDENGDLGTTVEAKYKLFIWAEESGALGNNNTQWSFGNGATGNIGVVIWEDSEIVGMTLSTENTTGDATVAVTLDGTNVGTITVLNPNRGAFVFFPAPIPVLQGQRLGFRTVTDTGRTDARVGALVEFTATLDAIGIPGSTDEEVKASASDTTPGTLFDKFAATGRLSLAILNPGADEVLSLSVADPAADAISYDNTASGLLATDVQAALDEVEDRVDLLEAGGAGLTPTQHEDLDTLVHRLSENFYTAVTRDGIGRAVNITTYTDVTETLKIREHQVTFAGPFTRRPAQTIDIQYDGAGVEVQRLTKTYTYVGIRLDTITAVET